MKIKELYNSGVTGVIDLYNKIVAWFTGIFGAELEAVNNGFITDYLKEKVKAKLAEVIEKLKKLGGIGKDVIAKIKAKVEELMKSEKWLAIAKYFKNLWEKYTGKSQDDAPVMALALQSNDMISFNDFKCTDAMKRLLSADFCAKLEDMAKKLGLAYDEVMEIIKNVKDVVTDVKGMYNEIVKFMNELSCAKILGADKCAKIQKLADLFYINLNKVIVKLNEWYNAGVQNVKDLWKKVKDWVLGIFGKDIENAVIEQGFIDFDMVKEWLKAKMNAIIAKLNTIPELTQKLIAEIKLKIMELINSGKFQAVYKYMKDLIEKYFP